jgi:outer membrane lipoprotein SlyB
MNHSKETQMKRFRAQCMIAAAVVVGLAGCASTDDPYRTTYPTGQSYPAYPAQEVARYGYVESIEMVGGEQRRDNGLGVGAVGGAIAGGVLGSQVGHGTGRAAATVGGAVIGGVVGHQVEQHVRGNQTASGDYMVRVRMDDGSYQTFRKEASSNVRVGDRVRVEGGTIYSM